MKKKILIGVIIAAVVAGGIFFIPNPSNVKSQTTVQSVTLKKADLLSSVLVSGTVKSSNTANVYSKISNYNIKEVNVKVGDKVKAGDVLAKLDTTALELDIKQTELNIKNAEATLKNEQAANKYNLENATNNVTSASLDLKDKQNNYDEQKKLYDESKISDSQLAQAETALKKAQISYDNAQANLNNIKSKSTTTASNNIEIQKASLEKQKKTLNDAKIVAPSAGTVTLVNAKAGGSAAGLLFVVEDTDNLIISTAIGEYDIHSVRVGQAVIIKSDSTGDKEFIGSVSKIAPTAAKDASGNTASSSNVQFDTEITMNNKDQDIKIGMNVRLTIKLDEKKNVYAVPYDAVVTDNDGSQYINVIETPQNNSKPENAPRKIKVQKGMETDMYVEVISEELADGMNVQTNPGKIAQ